MPYVEDPLHFLNLAFGYYVTGRFAALNQLTVGPNVIHHAVELLLKFALLKDVPRKEQSTATKQVKSTYGHDLQKLWGAFKQKVAPANLVRFDPVINNLHRWEDLRYGGFPNANPLVMGIGLLRGQIIASDIKVQDIYNFGLQEVDELFTAIVTVSNINPAFIGMRHRHKMDLRDWYLRENQHVMLDLFDQ